MEEHSGAVKEVYIYVHLQMEEHWEAVKEVYIYVHLQMEEHWGAVKEVTFMSIFKWKSIGEQ